MGGKRAANKQQEITAVESTEETAQETAEELEPIPHNDQRALAAEVNRLRGVVAELETKFNSLLEAFSEPEKELGEGGSN